MDQYIGEIRIFAGTFAPWGWVFCDGYLLAISEYEPLFQLIGTTYGGDGVDEFAVPDLRGRVPIHMGFESVSGINYVLGQYGGQEEVTLLPTQIPSHDHGVVASGVPVYGGNPGSTHDPIAAYPAISPGNKVYSKEPRTEGMDPLREGFLPGPANALSVVGGYEPHSNMQPFLCLNFIIATEGVYPSEV